MTNNASATGTPAGGILTDPTDSATAIATQLPALSLDKTTPRASRTAPSATTIDYQYLVTNTGNVTISDVSVSDDQRRPLTRLRRHRRLAPGDEHDVHRIAHRHPGRPRRRPVVNNATATGTPAGGTLTDRDRRETAHGDADARPHARQDDHDRDVDSVGDVLTYSFELDQLGQRHPDRPVHASPTTAATDESCPVTATLAPGAFDHLHRHVHRDPGRPRRRLGHEHGDRQRLRSAPRPSRRTPTASRSPPTQTPALTIDKTITAR